MGNNNSRQNHRPPPKVRRYLLHHEKIQLAEKLKNGTQMDCPICSTGIFIQWGFTSECGHLYICDNHFCAYSICVEHNCTERCESCSIAMCRRCGHTCPKMSMEGFLIL